MTRTARPIVACGAGLAIVLVMVARLDARAETATFLGLLGVAAAIYVAALYLVAHRSPGSSRALAGCLLLALAWRVALMTGAPLVSDDVYRYIWDGRVQQFGYNPYESVPDDPALAHLHTEPTALIDPTSAALPTIYPPAAQLFFRGVTTLHDSVTMMVTAIVLCDLLTALVLWRWLIMQRRNPWWMLAYAWHPLVALEGAGGGHIDIVGTLLIVAAAYALSARRPLVASLALAVAFSVKFLPVVLIPLLWDRVRCRDIVMAVGVVVLLYLPFSDGLRAAGRVTWRLCRAMALQRSVLRVDRAVDGDGWCRGDRRRWWCGCRGRGAGLGSPATRPRRGPGRWQRRCSCCPPCIHGIWFG